MPPRTYPESAPSWTADQIRRLIREIRTCAAVLSRRLHECGDAAAAAAAMSGAGMLLCPPVFIFISQGHGTLGDLGLSRPDVASYMIFLSAPEEMCGEIMARQGPFSRLLDNLPPAEREMLAGMCLEITGAGDGVRP